MYLYNRLLFVDGAFRFEDSCGFIGTLKCGINSDDGLFDELADILNFPAYFGANWNALLDCLTDFNWIDEKRIAIVHSEMPSLEKDSLKIYFEVLCDAMHDWGEGDDHELFVVFPERVRGSVLKAMR